MSKAATIENEQQGVAIDEAIANLEHTIDRTQKRITQIEDRLRMQTHSRRSDRLLEACERNVQSSSSTSVNTCLVPMLRTAQGSAVWRHLNLGPPQKGQKGGNAMKLSYLMAVKAVICFVFGIGFVLIPAADSLTLRRDAESRGTMMTQLFGAAFILLSILLWFARNAPGSDVALRAMSSPSSWGHDRLHRRPSGTAFWRGECARVGHCRALPAVGIGVRIFPVCQASRPDWRLLGKPNASLKA